MKETSQVERILLITTLISKSNGLTLCEITKKIKNDINVSERTIRRDVDLISKNFNIYEETRNGKTYYYLKDYSLDKVNFSLQDYLSIYFAKEVMGKFKNIKMALDFIALINRIFDNPKKLDLFSDFFKITVSDIVKEKEIKDNLVERINVAINKRTKIKISYTDSKKVISERIIDPYFISIYEGCYHLICFCNVQNDIRDFRISRINSLEVLKDKFTIDKNKYESIEKNRFGKLYSTYEIDMEIEFSKEIADYIKEYESDKADIIEKLENGNIVFKIKTNYSPEIIKWILKFGKHAKVLKPKSLFLEIKDHVDGLKELYT